MTDIRHHQQDIAIALNYDGKNAPRITAKGEHELARQILELAEQANVPLQYDPELAAILAQIPLGEEIPQDLYRAVAEVIAFAYFIAGKTPAGWEAPNTANSSTTDSPSENPENDDNGNEIP